MSADIYTKIGRSRYRMQCGGPATSNIVVPLTAPLYSGGNWINYGDATYSFNFADLNTVPAEAFDGQRRCRIDGDCATIVGGYTPMLPLPTEIRNLDQEWIDAGCRGTTDRLHVTAIPLATPAPAATNDLL